MQAVITAKVYPGVGCGTDQKLLIYKFQIQLKQRDKAKQCPQYNSNHITTIFKKTRNCYKAVNLNDRKAEEM